MNLCSGMLPTQELEVITKLSNAFYDSDESIVVRFPGVSGAPASWSTTGAGIIGGTSSVILDDFIRSGGLFADAEPNQVWVLRLASSRRILPLRIRLRCP